MQQGEGRGNRAGKQLALPTGVREGFRKEKVLEIGIEASREACQGKVVLRLGRR